MAIGTQLGLPTGPASLPFKTSTLTLGVATVVVKPRIRQTTLACGCPKWQELVNDGAELAAVEVGQRVSVLRDDLAATQCQLPQLLSKRLDVQLTPQTVHGRHIDRRWSL